MITYEIAKAGSDAVLKVVLDGRWVGDIRKAPGGFQYCPKSGERGAIRPTVPAVKREIEGSDED